MSVLIAGVVLFVSAIGVYIREMSQIVTLVTMLTLFLSPVFYPITAVPEGYRFLLYLNPLTYRRLLRSAARRRSGFHIGRSPKRIMRPIRNHIRFIRLKKFPDRS